MGGVRPIAWVPANDCHAGLARAVANGTPLREAAIPGPVEIGARSVHADRTARMDRAVIRAAEERIFFSPQDLRAGVRECGRQCRTVHTSGEGAVSRRNDVRVITQAAYAR